MDNLKRNVHLIRGTFLTYYFLNFMKYGPSFDKFKQWFEQKLEINKKKNRLSILYVLAQMFSEQKGVYKRPPSSTLFSLF